MVSSTEAFLKYHNNIDVSFKNVKNILSDVSTTALFYLLYREEFSSDILTLVNNAIFSFRMSDLNLLKGYLADWLYHVTIGEIAVHLMQTQEAVRDDNPTTRAEPEDIVWYFNEERNIIDIQSIGDFGRNVQYYAPSKVELVFNIVTYPEVMTFKFMTTQFPIARK